jgi:hypothetical protein
MRMFAHHLIVLLISVVTLFLERKKPITRLSMLSIRAGRRDMRPRVVQTICVSGTLNLVSLESAAPHAERLALVTRHHSTFTSSMLV